MKLGWTRAPARVAREHPGDGRRLARCSTRRARGVADGAQGRGGRDAGASSPWPSRASSCALVVGMLRPREARARRSLGTSADVAPKRRRHQDRRRCRRDQESHEHDRHVPEEARAPDERDARRRRPERRLEVRATCRRSSAGSRVSMKHFFENTREMVRGKRPDPVLDGYDDGITTISYPEQKRPYPERFRGVHRLTHARRRRACAASRACAAPRRAPRSASSSRRASTRRATSAAATSASR